MSIMATLENGGGCGCGSGLNRFVGRSDASKLSSSRWRFTPTPPLPFTSAGPTF
jgi:hypothetical protein